MLTYNYEFITFIISQFWEETRKFWDELQESKSDYLLIYLFILCQKQLSINSPTNNDDIVLVNCY